MKLASNLLSEDGVIFISIDDEEVANLQKHVTRFSANQTWLALWDKPRASVYNDKCYFRKSRIHSLFARDFQSVFENAKPNWN